MRNENWYVIYTRAGQEENLVTLIKKQIGSQSGVYRECFTLKYENVWKKGGESHVEIEVMFNGYVFITSLYPERLYEQLKKIPQLTKMLSEKNGKEIYFSSLAEEETKFIKSLLADNKQGDFVVKRSFVKREGTKITKAMGPLASYMENIVLADYQKRRVVIEKMLFGTMRRIKLCIQTAEDCVREGVEIPVFPGEEKKAFIYHVGDKVYLKAAAYKGKAMTVAKVDEKRQMVGVYVEMFGMGMEMLVGVEEIK